MPHQDDRPLGQSAVSSDEVLMSRVQANDAHAFEQLYDRYSANAFGLARALCDSSERAEEAVQDAFLCVWRTRAGYDSSRGGIRTWLFALVRNRSIDIYRHHRRGDRLRAAEDQLKWTPAPGCVEDAVVERDEGRALRTSVRRLPANQRDVIVLAYFGGLSHTEIAALLELPLGTVKSRMRLGLSRMRVDIDRVPTLVSASRCLENGHRTAGAQLAHTPRRSLRRSR